MVIHAKADRV